METTSHPYMIGLVIVLLVASIVNQCILAIIYQKMQEEASNIENTKNKLLLGCVKTFKRLENTKDREVEIAVYIDKFMNNVNVGGMKLKHMGHLSGQLMLFSVFVSGVGSCKGIVEGMSLVSLLPYYIIIIFGLYAYFAIASFIDIPGKKKSIEIALSEYLRSIRKGTIFLQKKEKRNPLDCRLEMPTKSEWSGLIKRKEIEPVKTDEELEFLLREFLES